MGELMALLVTSVLVNNVILTQFLGMCPFMGVSKKKSSAIGMGVAVVFVIVVAALVTYALYYLVLVPLQLELDVYKRQLSSGCFNGSKDLETSQ